MITALLQCNNVAIHEWATVYAAQQGVTIKTAINQMSKYLNKSKMFHKMKVRKTTKATKVTKATKAIRAMQVPQAR